MRKVETPYGASGGDAVTDETVEIDMEKEFTAFIRASGVGSWHTGKTPEEAAKKAVAQFKRDFKHIFKLKKNYEYKVAVFDTTGIEEWVVDDFGYLHPLGDQNDDQILKEYEILKIVA